MASSATERIIALVDMDCFYCQVEARLNPEIKGKPVAVVQYYEWKGGGIIAVNYEAKAKGVTRGMRGEEAKRLCPDINLVSVPVLRGKADLSRYRAAGEEVAKIFSDFSDVIQRASIDEAYIDLTKAVKERISNGELDLKASHLKSTYIIGHSDMKSNNEEERASGVNEWIKLMKENTLDSPDIHLTVGGMIVEEMRKKILDKTGFHCSAGIAHNKILAKLVAGIHKPRHQTILPQDNVPELYESLPIYKVKSLGGKFGKQVAEKLSVKYMSGLYKYSLKELQEKFDEKSGMWLYNIARGVDAEAVTPRLVAESIGCCKNFRGLSMLKTKNMVEHWVRELSDEISERLKEDFVKNKRRARSLTVSLQQAASVSRSDALSTYDTKGIAKTAMELLKKFNNAPAYLDVWDPPIKFLGLSVGNFSKEQENISTFIKNKSGVKLRESDKVSETSLSTETGSKSDCKPFTSSVRSASSERDPTKSEDTSRGHTQKSFFLSFLNNRLVKGVDKKSVTVPATDKSKTEEMEVVPVEETKSVLLDKPDKEASETNLPSCNLVDTADLVNKTKLCEACNQYINILDFFEHLDYHTALKLQREINGEINPRAEGGINTDERTVLKDLKYKRKRVEKGKQTNKKCRDIKSFFPVITKQL